jgi:hypothetical protein
LNSRYPCIKKRTDTLTFYGGNSGDILHFIQVVYGIPVFVGRPLNVSARPNEIYMYCEDQNEKCCQS